MKNVHLCMINVHTYELELHIWAFLKKRKMKTGEIKMENEKMKPKRLKADYGPSRDPLRVESFFS